MKEIKKGLLCFLLLLAPFVVSAQIEAAVQLEITAPSDSVEGEENSKIAPGRSFYVMGNITDGVEIPENATFSVQINKGSEIVRECKTSIQTNPNLNASFSGLNFYSPVTGEDIIKSGMPDLIWDGSNDQSFYNGDAKCYFNDKKFAALICGGTGAVDEQMNWKDASGNAYQPLEKGTYVLKAVMKKAEGSIIASAEKTIEIGASANKVMSRFSDVNGNGHFARVQKFAADNKLRIYMDAFPGYWSQEVFAEILPEWRAADATEYSEGKVHFLIYNVKPTSAIYAVELAQLERMGDVEDASRLANYYYTYGEPTVNDKESSISQFAAGDKLQFTRADVEQTGDKTEDNVYDVTQKADETDYDVTDGVSVKCGETLSLFGVTAPIQIEDSDIVDNGKNAYTLNNQIATLRYTLQSPEISDVQVVKEVSLNRVVGDWSNPSQLEFKHDFKIPDAWAGQNVILKVQGYDKHDAYVAGTDETIELHVAAASTTTPAPTATATPTASPTLTASPAPTTSIAPTVSPAPTASLQLAPPVSTSIAAPAKVSIKKAVSTKKKTMTVTWKKCKGSGYKILISTNKKMTKNKKTVTIKSAKTVKKTIVKLKARKYYVKVRAYKNYGSKKIFGKWSSRKMVKVR